MDVAAFSPELLLDLREFLAALRGEAGESLFDDRTAVVYGPVIDQQWPLPLLNRRLETSIPGLYVAGDTQGKARGIVQAMFSGWVVARSIVGQEAVALHANGSGALP
jgi:uncharacterized FAD-dependent dehydrogenase